MLLKKAEKNLEGKNKKSFLDGAFGRYFLPGIILQSVLIGGGFATGREIVEYGAKFGAKGWIAGIAIFAGFTIMSILLFEFSRIFKTYDYRTLLKQLIGRAWILYDIIYLLLATLIIAVMAAATGEILNRTLHINYWIGVLSITLLVGLLNFYGERFIEKFKTFGTISLFTAYIIFGILVISNTWGNSKRVLLSGDTGYLSSGAGLSIVLWTGILYVGYNLAVYPATLFTLKRQRSRKETYVSGIISGLLMCIPWFLTYFCILGYYPQEEVLGAPVPWLVMLEDYGSFPVIIFGIVVGWTLVETATGMIHAFIDRINSSIMEVSNRKLTKRQRGLIAVAALIIAIILAQVGIIDLIGKGYYIMAYGMIAVYAIPMLTIGVYRIFISRAKKLT